MNARGIVVVIASVVYPLVALAQGQPPRLPAGATSVPAASVQAPADPGYAALIATCKTPPPAGRGRGGGGGRGGAGRRRRAPAPGIREYTVTEIPGVIAAGQQWKFLWQEAGNNGDGILGTDDGGLLLAQNDNSKVVKLDHDGKASVAYSDTHTGGALSMNTKGALFIVQRGLRANVTQLAPQRRVLANSYQGDPLDCIGGVINDLTADSKGGVYFTMGGVYYADPKGVVTKYGEDVTPNGIVLSADEKTLYVTNGPAHRGVRRAGRRLADQPARVRQARRAGGGDGLTIDSAGRLYVTTQRRRRRCSVPTASTSARFRRRAASSPARSAARTRRRSSSSRAAPRDADGTEVANAAQVWSIPMIAQGYKGRAK